MKIGTIYRFESLKMWTYRRMLRISWVDAVTNDEVLGRLENSRGLLTLMKMRNTTYLGHISGHQRFELPKLITEKNHWLKDTHDWTGLDSHTLLRTTQNCTEFAKNYYQQ